MDQSTGDNRTSTRAGPSADPVTLTPDLLVARGHHRACYVHPRDPSACIKVYHRPDPKDRKREQTAYRVLERNGADWRLLSRLLGEIDTNLGRGYVFELIRDHDGSVSRTLEHYLNPDTDDAVSNADLRSALDELRRFLIDNRVISQEIAPRNLVFRRRADGGGDLLMIDDIGNRDYIPIRNHLAFMARNRIRLYWARFEARLRDAYGLDLGATSGPDSG
ncbi:YrbL family protein [Salinisphaera sp. P385]|uniref:YrbL family protein n=1 Tax=Spectribacter acetivorans TaxID=3075603 RepID=A0ABU3BDD4_9GAMM|nr:YrbL family protein [Salinisphaera sp. P385]MDT0619036.1 YrbL family protein [Salinisphaera sp. P385]